MKEGGIFLNFTAELYFGAYFGDCFVAFNSYSSKKYTTVHLEKTFLFIFERKIIDMSLYVGLLSPF